MKEAGRGEGAKERMESAEGETQEVKKASLTVGASLEWIQQCRRRERVDLRVSYLCSP